MIIISDGRIIIDTQIDSKGAEKGVKGLGGKLGGIAKTGLTAFTSLVAASGTALVGLGTIGVKYNAEMEQYMSSFTTMLGSAEKATKHLDDLKKFAAKTPFELGDLAKASTTLQAFGTDVKDINPILKMLGDISLGNKEKFNGLALVFGQVQSQGKLMGQDLMQMINQGFNPLQIISEKTGKSMSELKDEMSKGQISFEMVSDAMKTATSEGGKFYNAMEGQSKTLVGQWSTLKDNIGALLGDMFKSVSDVLTNKILPAINGVVEKIQLAFADGSLKASIDTIAEGFGNLAVKIGEIIADWLPKIIEGLAWILDNSNSIATGIIGIGTALMVLNVANMIMGLVKAFQAYKLATEGATVAQWLLNIAMDANPIGLIIAAIAGLVAGFIYLWNTNEGFREFWINAWTSIKDFFVNAWNSIMSFFTETIPSWIESIKAWFGSLGEWFGTLWTNIKQFFIDGWNAIASFFTETIPAWIQQMFDWFNELPYKIGYAMGFVLTTIIQWGVDTWNYLVTNVPKWINSIVNWFASLPGKIWTWLLNTINKIIQWGQQTYSNMVSAVTRAINAVIEWFAKLPGRIWEWLLNTIKKVIQFGRDLGAKAKDAGLNMVKSIIGAVKDLPSKFLDIGVNIVKGIWNGITNMGSWLHNKVTGFFQGMLDGAKKANDIHSPSRLYRDKIGAMMAQGVGVGFEDEADNVQKSIEKDFKRMAGKMQLAVDYNMASTTAGIVARNGNYGTSTETSTNDSTTENKAIIEVPVILEGREVARAVAPYQSVFTDYNKGR